MKRFPAVLVLAIAIVLSAYASSHAADTRTRGVRITPKPELTVDKLYNQSHAVIIGINAYKGFSSLDYAVKDARAMEQKLLSMGFQSSILLDQQATREGILKTLGDELPQRVQRSDRVIIFFAGHTRTEERADGTLMGYLVPADADAGNVFPTSISMDQIREISSRIKANHVLFLIDSCLAGLGLTAWETIPASDRNYLQKIVSTKGHQLLAAGGKGENAQSKEDGPGAFTAFVLEGLNGSADRDGKGFITSSELASYVKLQVSNSTAAKQVPQFGNIAGKGEIVFPSARGKTALNTDVPVAGQDTAMAKVAPAQKADEQAFIQNSRQSLEPVSQMAETTQSLEKDTSKMIEKKGPVNTDGLSLSAKQAHMEELKRLDAERRKAQVALKQPVPVPTIQPDSSGRFIAYDNGTILDTRTNLMWAAKDNGTNISWRDARNYCENYRAGGYTDWRMPTQEELAGLYDETTINGNPPAAGCNGGYHITNLIHLTCCCPWALETRGTQAAYFGFNNGPRSWLDQLYRGGGVRVLPVRLAK